MKSILEISSINFVDFNIDFMYPAIKTMVASEDTIKAILNDRCSDTEISKV